MFHLDIDFLLMFSAALPYTLSCYFPFFYQIGDADEAEKISPDEEAEKPDGKKTSGVEKNDNGDVEKLYQKQEEASTQVNVYK